MKSGGVGWGHGPLILPPMAYKYVFNCWAYLKQLRYQAMFKKLVVGDRAKPNFPKNLGTRIIPMSTMLPSLNHGSCV